MVPPSTVADWYPKPTPPATLARQRREPAGRACGRRGNTEPPPLSGSSALAVEWRGGGTTTRQLNP